MIILVLLMLVAWVVACLLFFNWAWNSVFGTSKRKPLAKRPTKDDDDLVLRIDQNGVHQKTDQGWVEIDPWTRRPK